MSARARPPSGGFTLVEVLLTLLIMTGIMLTITQVLTASRASRDEIHNIQERELAGPAILARIEQDLRSLLVYDRPQNQVLRVRNKVLSGFDADTLDLVCTADSALPFRQKPSDPYRYADVNEVGYCLRQRPDSDDFLELYRREGFGVDDQPFDGGRFALLHDRVKGLNIEIYDEDGPEAEPLEDWTDSSNNEYVGIPARLEISLTIELAPRLVREQLVTDTRTLTYKRIFRFPQSLRRSAEVQPKPAVPKYAPPVDSSSSTAGGGDTQKGAEEGSDKGGDGTVNPGGGGGSKNR